MKTALKIVSTIFLVNIAMVSIAESHARNPRASDIDKLFDQWARPNSPGAAIVIVKDGAVVYQHGYGYANLEHRIPITPQTRFDVASVAKQFAGLSVAMLVQQGKISLDDDIRKYLPDVPDFGKPITIRHLVHHISGLRDWPETLRLSGIDREAPISQAMILEMVRHQRELDFAPGEEYQYSNTGYNLLAATVTKVTGQSFRQWSDINIFQPLKMKHTLVCDNSAEIVPDFALSYTADGKEKFRRVTSQLSALGSSSLFISAEDMGKWLLNFETQRVGGKAALDLMRQPGKLNGGGKVDYGFGVALGDYRGSPIVTHSGSWAAYRSSVTWIPEKRFAIAFLANTDNMDFAGLREKVIDFYLDTTNQPAKKSPKPPAAVKADPSTWDAFLGTYRLAAGWLLTITREGDQLMTQASHEVKFPMTPTSDHTFLVKAYGASVEFVRQNSGAVTNLIYRGINARKLAASARSELTNGQLKDYVGDYWSEELQVVARVEIHNGKLALRERSGSWNQFTPVEPDHFDAERNWSVEFTRNAASEVVELKVSGGRVRNIRYTRVKLPKPNLPQTSPRR